jgi:hypothetical protein
VRARVSPGLGHGPIFREKGRFHWAREGGRLGGIPSFFIFKKN